jgi:ferritin-like protein
MSERMMQFFDYEHLREDLQHVSRPFHELAKQMVATLPVGPERTVMLRKLLEAKDCAVRAYITRE